MTCHDFQRKWNELLDAEFGVPSRREAASSAPIELTPEPALDKAEARLLAHAADCPECRPIAARYQVLRQAIRAWRQAPVPSADLVERVLSAPVETTPRPWRIVSAEPARRFWRDRRARNQLLLLSGFAAAAMLGFMLSGSIEWRARHVRRVGDGIAGEMIEHDLQSHTIPPKAPETSLALNTALVEATSATWDLARSASEPAARISRDVLDATPPAEESPVAGPVTPGEGLAGLSLAIPSLDPLAPDATAASAVFQQVGDRLSAGVEPISETARHAFGFLLGPPRPRAESRDRRASPTGARSG
jgi:hypothetical protein